MRYFETPKMNISMFDSIVTTTEGAAYVNESIVAPTMQAISALDTSQEGALVGRTSFNALMQVQK